MTREVWIERCLRQIYGGQPTDDATITVNLVNTWLPDAIAVAAKTNYKDNLQLDGIAYVNGGFYTTFKGIAVTEDESFLWKVALPEIPLGIGNDEGISTIQLKDTDSRQITKPFIWITQAQKGYYQNMRTIPNKLLCYLEGGYIYIISTILLNDYTATVCMVSGGDDSDLDSELNVPPDYFPAMVEYVKQQLMFERNVPQDLGNDGVDLKTTA
jgi:hypothetical protein